MEPIAPFTMPRRTLLVAAGASSLLAACGGSSGDGSGDEGNATDSTGQAGDVVAAVGDVPVGGGAVNTDVHVVVTQPEQGQYAGFSSICTHRQCDVSTVQDNVISCPCHGSKYSAETGEVVHGPATQALAAVAVAVDGDNIVRA